MIKITNTEMHMYTVQPKFIILCVSEIKKY